VRKTTTAALAAVAFALLMALAGPAAARDRNGDRIPDRWEKRHHLSLRVNQAKRDQDGDGLRNRGEFKAGLDPRDDDSDDDGTLDGDEHAGTVDSFDAATGTLTIKLFGGGSVTGLVTDATEVECDDDSARASHDGDDDGDRSGPSGDDDRSGPGDGDRGDRDDDEGDDDHGDDDECGTEALTAGREVDEAELKLSDGKATFRKIELD